jgi:hypothetical protein
MLQLLPFQCSANVLFVAPIEYRPTAKQLVVVGHATALNVVPVDALGFGLDVDDHAAAAPAGVAVTNTPPAAKPAETTSVKTLERRERREEIK